MGCDCVNREGRYFVLHCLLFNQSVCSLPDRPGSSTNGLFHQLVLLTPAAGFFSPGLDAPGWILAAGFHSLRDKTPAAGVSAANRMSCCCCVTPRQLLDGIQEEDQEQMEVSVLRELYRSCREAQRIHPQVLLLRTVSEDVVTVPQGMTLPWEPTSTSDLDLTFDPWHVHLDLHRRCSPGGTRTSRRSESGDRNVSLGSGSHQCARETSLCGSSGSSRDDRLEAGLDSDGSGEELHPDLLQLQARQEERLQARQEERLQARQEERLQTRQEERLQTRQEERLQTRQEERLQTRQEERLQTRQEERLQTHQQNSSRSRRLLSFPFPSRRTPRISEAARRLGMYSSF
ncbi:uncharacterized protein LOC110968346 [Acanthochromis polyacanthus]|uniref:uncharacterized protein LOC110968346 n=1 Tax=Acanthochromis polyacanthus TaxID=80966 RepID=UPI0022340C0E|nr:uncharacterized protein LOC110968346 [Acanthochromis polyacanthus]